MSIKSLLNKAVQDVKSEASKVEKTAQNAVKTVTTDAKNVVTDAKSTASWLPKAAGTELNQVKDGFINAGGAAIGYAELAGLKYPVKQYQAKVSDNLTRGSRVDLQGMAKLQAEGYRSVVDLRAESNSDAPTAQALGMNDLHLSIIDNTPPTNKQVKQFLDFVTNPKNEPAYVHCEAGQGRTGVMCACYRMAVQGWSADKALAEAEKYGDKMPDQQAFIRQFGADLKAGKIKGYPLTGAAQQKALTRPPPNAPLTMSQLSTELDKVSHSKATPGNSVKVFVDGENAFPQVLAQIDSAKKSIQYETYNFLPGEKTTEEVADHLIAAKKRGVDVRLVVDAVGSRDIGPEHNSTVDRLRAAGIPVQYYDPIDGVDDLNIHRDHRKSIVIDGNRAFIGGMNTGDKYFGGPNVPGRLHDMFALVQGPAVKDINADWVSSWKAAGGGPLPASETNIKAPPEQPNGVTMRVVEHTPGQDENIDKAYLAMINSATKQINVENSYPMRPDIVAALSAAARRGVDVRYIVGSHQGMLGIAARANYQQLLDAGVHVYMYPTPIHTKSISVDGRICSFGSSNVDNVALSRNREIVGIVQDPKFTQNYNDQMFNKDVVGDPQGAKTIELPKQLHDSIWQKLETAVVSGLWPATLK